MNIELSWDIFIGVIFLVIIAYSFIIGQKKSLKIVIATYLAILTADGLGNFLEKYFIKYSPLFKGLSPSIADQYFIMLKISIFILVIVFVAIKGGYTVTLKLGERAIFRGTLIFLFGFLNAALIVSTILVYISGSSFVQGGGGDFLNNTLVELYNQSRIVKIMIANYNVWFSLPAILFIFFSMIQKKEE